MKTVTVEKKASKSKKNSDGIDWDFVEQITASFEDIKHGRIKKWEH